MVLNLIQLVRSLRRSPTSAGAAVLTLAVALGAGTTIGAVVDAVLLTPPMITDPESVVTLAEAPMATPGAPRMISYSTFEAWGERAAALATLAAFDGTNLTLTGLGAAERIGATDVDPQFLPLLGVSPSRGRSFRPEDVGQALAIVTHEFWQTRLGRDPAIVGTTIVLNGRSHEIVGVLPESFHFALTDGPIWRPLPLTAAQAVRTGFRMRALGRLAPGTTPASLQAALDQVSTRGAPPFQAVVTPVATAIARGSRGTFGLLAAAAAIATVMAFFNLMGLLVVRSMDRAQELAVRVAMGARPSAVVRHLMLEAEVLVAIGTAAGVLLAAWLTPVAAQLVQLQFGPIMNRDIEISWRVVAVVAAVAAACAAMAASLPALLAARRAAAESLRRGRTRSPRELALRRFVIAGEVALAFVLLVSMALLAESLAGALQRYPGFRPDGVMTLGVSLPAARYAGDREVATFYATLPGALDERLGAGTTAVVDELPLTGDGGRSLLAATPTDTASVEAVVRAASPSYFDVIGIPIVAGRGFEARDDESAPRRVVVSARLAAKLFGTAPAVGQTVFLAGARQPLEIVGVVGDVMHRSVDEQPLDTAYLPMAQVPSRTSRIVIRATRPRDDVAAVVRDQVARLDRDLPVYGVAPMTDVVAASAGMPARRVLTGTFTAFALLALVLSAVGLFAIVAHDVAGRRSELALRVALGAPPAGLLAATLRQGAAIIVAGIAGGLALSLPSGRMLTTLAPATKQFDLTTALGVAAALLIVGLSAVLLPARRAARTDPLAVLRAD